MGKPRQPWVPVFVAPDGHGRELPRRYAQSTSGRSDSHVTAPWDSRSMLIASASPHLLCPPAMFNKCPSAAEQRRAKSDLDSAGRSSRYFLSSMPTSHQLVRQKSTPAGVLTTWCNSGMTTRQERSEIRRENLK